MPTNSFDRFKNVEPSYVWINKIEQYRSSGNVPSDLPRVDDYYLLSMIGTGGMAKVFSAWDKERNKFVAIKLFEPRRESKWSLVQRFQKEADILGQLDHPSIIGLLGRGNLRGRIYLVIDLIEGVALDAFSEFLAEKTVSNHQVTATEMATSRSQDFETDFETDLGSDNSDLFVTSLATSDATAVLGEWANRIKPFSAKHFKLVARVGSRVCDALAYSHEKSILHRDIKPSNLLIDKNGKIFLTDFGLAIGTGQNVAPSDLTRQGDLLGTIAYMPPQVLHQKYSERTDLYSVGATLYELATLQPLWGDASETEILHKLFEGTLPNRCQVAQPEIPDDLANLIDGLVASEFADSTVSAKQFAVAFESFAVGKKVVSPKSTSHFQFRVKQTMRAWLTPSQQRLLGTLCLVLTLLFLAFNFYLYRSRLQVERFTAESLNDDIQVQLERAENAVSLLRSSFENQEIIDPLAFENFAQLMRKSQPGILSIGLAEKVENSNRTDFEANISDELRKREITAIREDGQIFVSPEQDWYAAVSNAYPEFLRDKVLGLDLRSDPVRRAALEKAIETDSTAAAGPVVFYDQDVAHPGFVLIDPLTAPGIPNRYALVVFRFDELLASVDSPAQDYPLHLQLTVAESDAVIYSGDQRGKFVTIDPSAQSIDESLEICGSQWRLRYFSEHHATSSVTPMIFDLLGLLAIFIIPIGLFFIIRNRSVSKKRR